MLKFFNVLFGKNHTKKNISGLVLRLKFSLFSWHLGARLLILTYLNCFSTVLAFDFQILYFSHLVNYSVGCCNTKGKMYENLHF